MKKGKKNKLRFGRGNVIRAVIVAVVLALVGLAIWYMQSVSALTMEGEAGYTASNCSSVDMIGSEKIYKSYYKFFDSSSSKDAGITKTYDMVGARYFRITNVFRTSLTMKNLTDPSNANSFAKGDKVRFTLDVRNPNDYFYQEVNPRIYVSISDDGVDAEKPIAGGFIGGKVLPVRIEVGDNASWANESIDFTIPTTIKGKLVVRLLHYRMSETWCGPSIKLWSIPLKNASSNTGNTGTEVTEEPVANSQTYTIKPGFNAFQIPWTTKVLKTQPLEDAGMTVWTYNRHGDDDWDTTGVSVNKFYHRLGYYIYNPGSAQKVTLSPAINQEEPETTSYITEGWNLLSNAAKSIESTIEGARILSRPMST